MPGRPRRPASRGANSQPNRLVPPTPSLGREVSREWFTPTPAVAPLETEPRLLPGPLADAVVEVAAEVLAHLEERGPAGRLDQALAAALRPRHQLGRTGRRFAAEAVMALARWQGWISPKRVPDLTARLLLAWLLDADHLPPAVRVWARSLGYDPHDLVPLGDAPSWPARSEAIKRARPFQNAHVAADPWRLVPDWFRRKVVEPPGEHGEKAAWLELIQGIQKRPSVWIRTQGGPPEPILSELRARGLAPWIHRRLLTAARLGPDADTPHDPLFQAGRFEVQDLGSQAIGWVAAPKPGQRWWDACAGAGGKTLHLADLTRGKGLIVATDHHAGRLKELTRRQRRAGFSHIRPLEYDLVTAPEPPPPGQFDGVLIDAPCTAMGTWRRNPEARWRTPVAAIEELGHKQRRLLERAAQGVAPGGVLIYAVCSLTIAETTDVIASFLKTRPEFAPEPFDDPLTGQPTSGLLWIWPHLADSDGHFVARLRRRAST